MSSDLTSTVIACNTIEASTIAETRESGADVVRVKTLVRSAIQLGLFLDDPWRLAYLRARWIGHAV